jgi:flavodoxin
MSDETGHVYVMVAIQPGKEQEFANEIISKALILDSIVEKMDFVQGDFDFIVILTGNTHDIDRRILEMRKIPYVQSTETLIPFEMLNWDDIGATLKEPNSNLPKINTHCKPSLELELMSNCAHPIVLYSTKGGSTKRIAVEIASELNCQCTEITKHSDSSTINLSDFDLVLIGTGIYRKCPNADMVRFLEAANLNGNKQFGLFLTWFKLEENDRVVFHKIDGILEAKGKKLLDGYFECLGDCSRGHPNAEDLSAARKWVSKIAKKA